MYRSPPAPPPAAFPTHPPEPPPPTTRAAIEVTLAGINTSDVPTVVFLYTQFPDVKTKGETQLTEPLPTETVALVLPATTDEMVGTAGFKGDQRA